MSSLGGVKNDDSLAKDREGDYVRWVMISLLTLRKHVERYTQFSSLLSFAYNM